MASSSGLNGDSSSPPVTRDNLIDVNLNIEAAAPAEDLSSATPPEGLQVHIHLDLDSDAGMQQARALLSAVFCNVHAPLNAGALPGPASAGTLAGPANAGALPGPANAGALPGPANAGALPGPPNAGALPGPANAGALAAPASPVYPGLPVPGTVAGSLPSDGMAALQQLLQLGGAATPTLRRRPGRPSRAETEFRAMLNNLNAQAQATPQARPSSPAALQCNICSQMRADTLLRQCRHTVCRMCILPFISLRPVCPIKDCGLPCNPAADLIPISFQLR